MSSRHGKPTSRGRRCAAVVAGGVAVAAFVALAAWAVVAMLTPPGVPNVARTAIDVAPAQPISQDGRIVAVTDTSVTAVGTDGVPHTFLVTPDTTAVTTQGGRTGAASTSFAVNDEVSIVGEVRGGTPVATAVAAHAATGPDGPPMDFPAA